MATATIYGTGVLYGAEDYGRISPEILAAQEARVRSTGLKVSITDENLNQWEFVAGQDWGASALVNTAMQYELDYRWYRGTSSTCVLSNGNIVRVRVGDGTQSDRQVWIQNISDPENAAPSAWTSWSVLYSGTHYGILVVANGVSYDVYDTRSTGLYKNNSNIWTPTDDGDSKVLSINKVIGSTNAFFIGTVRRDMYATTERDLDYWYTPDLGVVTPTPDPMNFRWKRNQIRAFLLEDGRVARLHVNGLYHDPRSGAIQGDSLSVSFNPDISTNEPTPPYLLRGVGNGWGKNEILLNSIGKLADGYYYIFCGEAHWNEEDILMTEGYPTFWQRSKDLLHWSEPVAVTNTFGTMVETDNYVWFLGNGSVTRRTKVPVVYDLTNYVPNLSLQIPRDNQAGSGTIVVANPAGVNDSVMGLEGRRITVEIGIKGTDGDFEFFQFNDWWMKHVSKEVDRAVNRLKITICDLWGRLANPLRDTFNFVGQTVWDDWSEGKRNKAFNYYFSGNAGSPVETEDFTLTGVGNPVLYTGWRGTNVKANITFIIGDFPDSPDFFIRYIDPDNYIRVWTGPTGGSIVYLDGRVKGPNDEVAIDYNIDSASSDPITSIRVEFNWGAYKIWVNGSLIMADVEVNPRNLGYGYVGFGAHEGYYSSGWEVKDFHLDDFEPVLDTEYLIRTALAMGDFHEAKIAGATSRQVALVWGPQTDLATPAAAMKQLLETDKLQLIWREGFVELGQFKETSVVKVIEDRVVSTNQEEDEAVRVNLSVVDGNEDSWMEIDYQDTQDRDRQLIGYYDLPELLDFDAVKARAKEEIRRGQLGSSPGGQVILLFDLARMDAITWVDNAGTAIDARIEGMEIEVKQSERPSQRMNLVTSRLDSL